MSALDPARVAICLEYLRRHVKAQRKQARYQRDFHTFLLDYVYTQDEARAGVVSRMPNDPYMLEVCDALIEEPLLMFEKSRRVRASWIVSAFEIWLAAGGQDPRWPALMESAHNRQVIIASLKRDEIQGSTWFLRERDRFIYEQAVANGIREVWPEFPSATWKHTEARFSNGSRISAIASGQDQMRGAGATFIRCEEGAFWRNAKSSINSAIPGLLPKGHLAIVTTPQCNSFCHDIRLGRV